MNVTIEHIRAARVAHGGFCASGIRRWCERHQIDYRKLLQEGLPVEHIESRAPGDHFAQQVIAFARGEGA